MSSGNQFLSFASNYKPPRRKKQKSSAKSGNISGYCVFTKVTPDFQFLHLQFSLCVNVSRSQKIISEIVHRSNGIILYTVYLAFITLFSAFTVHEHCSCLLFSLNLCSAFVIYSACILHIQDSIRGFCSIYTNLHK